MDTFDLLQQLLIEISIDEKALEEKRQVAAFLQKRKELEQKTAIRMGLTAAERCFVDSVATTRMLGNTVFHEPEAKPNRTQLDMIEDVVDAMPLTEFTITDVASVLSQLKIPIASKTAISSAVGRMVTRGKLLRIEHGAGSAPNKYQKTRPGTGHANFRLDLGRWPAKENSGT